MKRKRLFLGLALGLVVALLPPAYAKQGEPTRKNTLTMAVPTLDADIFDGLRVSASQKPFLTLIYDSLVGNTIDGKISKESGVAYKWEMTSDGKTWTFYLRKGIKFPNGDEVTA